ncbi:MAG: sensor histidine kinase [Gaiellaceae bacterium]
MRNDAPLRFTFRLAWLVVLVIAVAVNASNRLVAVPLLATAAAAWVIWARSYRSAHTVIAIAAMGAAGGVLGLVTTVGLGFIAMAGIAAGSTFELRRAAPLALVGPAVLVAAFAAGGWSNGVVAGGAAGALAGLVGGIARRQAREKEREAERTHVARELHDVLAHTLAALAVQLEAAEAVLEAGDDARLRDLLARSRQLVTNGIEETAQAVRALRDEPVAIAERIEELVAGEIPLHINGTPRPLPAAAGLALYRAAQEGLTNARKHAPGAATEVSLAFDRGSTTVRVRNGAPPTPPADAPGSRLGLQGLRERLELAGGRLEAGVAGDGFVIEATVPV